MGTAALRVEGLQKQFGDDMIVESLALTVPRGRVLGLVGPAGSGKTTVASMVSGLLPPDEGTVRIAGHDLWGPEGDRSRVGVLSGDLPVTDQLSGRDALICIGLLRGLDNAAAARRATTLLAMCGLDLFAHVAVRDYRPQQRQLIGLAVALLGNPDLLVLEDVLDDAPVGASEVLRAAVLAFAAAGGGVLCTGRSADAAAAWCDRVAVLGDGTATTSTALTRQDRRASVAGVFLPMLHAVG